jgi:hypothetical protein
MVSERTFVVLRYKGDCRAASNRLSGINYQDCSYTLYQDVVLHTFDVVCMCLHLASYVAMQR